HFSDVFEHCRLGNCFPAASQGFLYETCSQVLADSEAKHLADDEVSFGMRNIQIASKPLAKSCSSEGFVSGRSDSCHLSWSDSALNDS
ncbi:hypothetical protein, partial [Escherichia coli]|uniref:hypothetical protein n=1 Tax=Escherichia coli TaxID=562 RepID=UPI001BDC576E